MKDIQLGLKSLMERFPSINLQSVASREYACFIWVKRPHSFMYGCGERKMTLIFLVPDCKCAMVKFLEERHTLLLGYDCKTGFATKILDPSSVAY